MRKTLIAGNWKMNGLKASLAEIRAMAVGFDTFRLRLDLLVAPPHTLLAAAAGVVAGSGMILGAQDCHPKASGAHTGDISARMLADAGAQAVIVGHSERRTDHDESSALVAAKAHTALEAGLCAIVCVGETRAQREAGQAVEVVTAMLRESLPESATPHSLVIAYEPVWAIGTGLVPTLEDIAQMHGAIRAELALALGSEMAQALRVLYGGSVKPENAADILDLPDVDGALVGGASLMAADFLAIAAASPHRGAQE